jgi:hypothetical protein
MSKPLDFAGFLATTEPPELGPGPRAGVQAQVALEEQLQPLLQGSGVSAERQDLIRALILLWHDHLDASHVLAQNVEGADGAFVHGIIHRREPDFGNAAYWFRKVGRHPAFGEIASQAAALLEAGSHRDLAGKLVHNREWDPFAFIDACEKASTSSDRNQSPLREVQRIEFNALLNYLRQ